jgi:hypothetical protein
MCPLGSLNGLIPANPMQILGHIGDIFDERRSIAATKKPGYAGLSECPRKESNLEPSD